MDVPGRTRHKPGPYTAGLLRDAITNAGGTVTYSYYPNKGHDVWYNAWAEPDFLRTCYGLTA